MALPHHNSGHFTSSVAIMPAPVTFPSQHLYPGSTTISPARHPDATSHSLLCPSCCFAAQNIRELVAHRQSVHWDSSQPWGSIHLKKPPPVPRMITAEEKQQRVFKCPYCVVNVIGRQAIENHVVIHSAGMTGRDRMYLCAFCTLKCRSAPGLSSHVKRHEYQGDC